MSRSSVERELTSVTKARHRTDEQRFRFLRRVIKKVSKLTDDDWDRLSPSAQSWHQHAAKAYAAKQPIVDFDGTLVDFIEGRHSKRRPQGLVWVRAYEMMLKDRTISKIALLDLLNAEGFAISRHTADRTWFEFQRVTRFLQQRGVKVFADQGKGQAKAQESGKAKAA